MGKKRSGVSHLKSGLSQQKIEKADLRQATRSLLGSTFVLFCLFLKPV
jgi:hypothetical protein